MIINSNRKFGVEIEFCTKSKLQLTKLSQRLPVVYDGSIKHIPNSGEFVSPVLSGEKGENCLVEYCETLKLYNAESEDPSMSMHIHLDGGRKEKELKITKIKPTHISPLVRVIALSNKAKDSYDVTLIAKELLNNRYLINKPNHYISSPLNNNFVFYSLSGILKKEPVAGYTYYYLEEQHNFNFLRNVLYFYTKYSLVMESLVSNSRKFPNMYCVPLAKSFKLEEISKLKTEGELRDYWYKGRETSRKRDDSRYHDVNLHCYFNGYGTVEIRSHGGTVDPNKILLWVRLHQTILDKLENATLDDINNFSSDYLGFIEFVDDELLTKYIKRLLGYFSKIKLN